MGEKTYITLVSVVLLVIIVPLLFGIIGNALERYKRRREKEACLKVERESLRYLYLLEIASKINSHPLFTTVQECIYFNSKRAFDLADPERQIEEHLRAHPELLLTLKKSFENKRLIPLYEKLIADLPDYNVPTPKALYDKKEHELTDRLQEKIRPKVPVFDFTLMYVSPAGRNRA